MRMKKKVCIDVPFGVFIPTHQDPCPRLGGREISATCPRFARRGNGVCGLAPISVRSGETIMTHTQVQTVVDCMASSVNI